jgi:hypothetical protein
VTVAEQIVRHLLENEEIDAFDDLDVGLPRPLGAFLGQHGFERETFPYKGFKRQYPHTSLRISDPADDGTRTVSFWGDGALPLWKRQMTDEDIVEMIDRNSRIGEAEEDEFDDVDTWKDLADTLPAAMEAAGFIQRGTNTWTFGINQWQSVVVTRLQDGMWNGKVNFQGVGAISDFTGTEIEMGRWLESMDRWPKYHFSDWNKFEAAARGKSIREEEDFGDEEGAWKDVSPPVNASQIQRWCFTDYEMRDPRKCRATDVFYADADSELAVIVLRDGTATNMWEDGTSGVPPYNQQLAELDESPVKPSHLRTIDTDYYGDNWRDVYVGKSGEFLGFVVRESEEDFGDEDFSPADVGAPNVEQFLLQNGFAERDSRRTKYFVKVQGNRQFLAWPGSYEDGWYLHVQKKNDVGVFQNQTQQVTDDPNEFLGWLRAYKAVSES